MSFKGIQEFFSYEFRLAKRALKRFPGNAARTVMKTPRGVAGWFWFLSGLGILFTLLFLVGVYLVDGTFQGVFFSLLMFFTALNHTAHSEWWWPQEEMPPFEVTVITETTPSIQP